MHKAMETELRHQTAFIDSAPRHEDVYFIFLRFISQLFSSTDESL